MYRKIRRKLALLLGILFLLPALAVPVLLVTGQLEELCHMMFLGVAMGILGGYLFLYGLGFVNENPKMEARVLKVVDRAHSPVGFLSLFDASEGDRYVREYMDEFWREQRQKEIDKFQKNQGQSENIEDE